MPNISLKYLVAESMPLMASRGYGRLRMTFRGKQDGDQSLVSIFAIDNPEYTFNEIMVSSNTSS